MTDKSSFMKTSYRLGWSVNRKQTPRSGSFVRTVDTDHPLDRTTTLFAKTHAHAFTRRLSNTTGQQTFHMERTSTPMEYGLKVFKAVADTDYQKRKIQPFVLSSRRLDDHLELTEHSDHQKKPYRIGRSNYSHGDFINGSAMNETPSKLGKVNTVDCRMKWSHSEKTFSMQHSSAKKGFQSTFVEYIRPTQSSDFISKRIDPSNRENQASVDQQ